MISDQIKLLKNYLELEDHISLLEQKLVKFFITRLSFFLNDFSLVNFSMNYLIMEQEKEMTLGVSIALDALKYKLGRVLNESSAGFKIRKVPEHLRTENVKAYEPQIIAIGPLNHYLPREKTHLAEMQRHKVLYLEKLLQRRGEDLSNLTRYCFTMGNSEERALCCYEEPTKIA